MPPADIDALAEPLVEAVIEDDRWSGFGLATVADRAVGAAMTEVGLPSTGFSVCVMGCGDARIATLNADFRGKAQPTNVLSWPARDLTCPAPGLPPDAPPAGTVDDPEPLGDIALGWDTCSAEAVAQGKTMEAHVTHLIVHGTLHLLGYGHDNDADAALMEGTETRVLGRLGVADPY